MFDTAILRSLEHKTSFVFSSFSQTPGLISEVPTP